MEHRYSPQELLDLLFKHVTATGYHINSSLPFTSASKLREEMVNRITATVSTFPRTHLNLAKLCFDVAPMLVDGRALVRLASLECVATLAQALGPHKLGSLMTAVHSLDTCLTPIDMDRLVGAIQARLARRSLPRTGPDGNVQYVLRVPNAPGAGGAGVAGDQSWYMRRIYDADLEWIAFGATTTPPSSLAMAVNNSLLAPPSQPLNYYSSQAQQSAEDNPTGNRKNGDVDEERLARQKFIASANSEDIPPPVKGSGFTGMGNSQQSRNKLDAEAMTNDQYNSLYNFYGGQQTYEMDERARSLERSKTVQEIRPYYYSQKKPDAYLDRLVRGESVDDSDLAYAQEAMMRRSSVESEFVSFEIGSFEFNLINHQVWKRGDSISDVSKNKWRKWL